MSSSDEFDYGLWGRNNYHIVCGLILESALYGVYAALLAHALRHLWFSDIPRNRARILTLLSLLVMFSMSTTLWALDITDFLRGLQRIIISDGGTATQRNSDYMIELNPRVIAQTTVFSAEYIIGDSVVVWRACTLWGYSKKVMFLPILLLIAATVMVSFFLGCLGMHDWSFIAGQPPICSNSYIAVLFLSIAINFIATMLIAIKAWMHYRLLLSAPINKKTQGIKILVLLFESGLIYLLIWGAKSASAFGTLSSTTSGQFTTTMLNMMGNQVVGLYPTLLLVLVHMQRSTLDADLESSTDWRRSSAGQVRLSDKYQTTGERIVFASPLETFGTV